MRQVRLLCLLWGALSMAAMSCDPSHHRDQIESGLAVVSVNASQLSSEDIARLVITVSGEGISPPIEVALPEGPENHWSGTIDDIPAGDNRTFMAEALDAADVIIYSGSATQITIEDGVTTSVSIFLQQVDPPVPFENAVPIITSFTVSPMEVAPGGDVALVVEAYDPNPDDALIFSWNSEAGSFSNAGGPSTTWTAPMDTGSYQVAISVSDPHGATAALSVTITVSITGGGEAAIDIAINTSPEVLGLVPTPSRIDTGESTQLDLTAVDAEGDSLGFEWSSDCDGTFNNTYVEDPVFTLSTLTGDLCTLTVLITDGAGGGSQASITIQTGPGITPIEPPPPGCEGAIHFPDANLEAAVRNTIGKPSGEIQYADIKALSRLFSEDSSISDLTGIECLNNLTELHLSGYHGISDLTPLASLSKLTYFYLDINYYDAIGDLSPLASLSNLTELHLYDFFISDLSPLASLSNLTVLDLHSNDISDLTPLASLSNLAVLELGSPNISDLSPLASLSNLTVLRLQALMLSDISPLAPLSNLTELYLECFSISDITPLASLSKLSVLELTAASINDISPLAGLLNLTILKLGLNGISDISPLAGLSNLMVLDLTFTGTDDLTPLSSLSNLTELYLEQNSISDVTPLASLSNLAILDLGLNDISDISPLATLLNLTELNLGNNDIGDISPLASLSNLVRLELRRNGLIDISPLALLHSLQILFLSDNGIVDISSLASLLQLTYLELENNSISDIAPLVANEGIDQGDSVFIYSNPIDCTDATTLGYIATLRSRGVSLQCGCD